MRGGVGVDIVTLDTAEIGQVKHCRKKITVGKNSMWGFIGPGEMIGARVSPVLTKQTLRKHRGECIREFR